MTETTTPYEERTVEDLRADLRARKLPASGSKAELVARLVEDDRDPQELTVDEPAAARPGECVVNDGTPHMGRATPGAVICSAHAMRYKADGTRR